MTADTHNLGPLARILLATDGTVTDILAAWYQEPMCLSWHEQHQQRLTDDPVLQLTQPTEILERSIRLSGQHSGQHHLYARSRIVLPRLPTALTQALLQGDQPIGLLLRQARFESHRQPLDWSCQPDAQATARLHSGSATLVQRAYRIDHQGQAVMCINEWFPAQ